jgi:hypothetical protein
MQSDSSFVEDDDDNDDVENHCRVTATLRTEESVPCTHHI